MEKALFISEEKLKSGVENGTRIFLESFQYPIWNKNVRKNNLQRGFN